MRTRITHTPGASARQKTVPKAMEPTRPTKTRRRVENMRYVSLFSGIEAASVAWVPLGWEPVAFAEIEPFPCAVLDYRFPDVPNLGDVTKIDWSEFIGKYGKIDLVCGGSPCQGFSVAGLRKGLNDPRGNLMLEFLRAVDEIKPEFVLWENVPGVLSDKTHAFDVLLESLQDLGYMIDADILDAQYFGLAQRRKRVFVLGWRVETLLKKKTDLSKKITEQCLLQILQSVLGVLYLESEKECVDSNCKDRLKDGLTKRMRLFDLHTADNFEMLLKSLVDAPQRYQAECKNLVSDLGKIFKDIPDMADINLDLEPTESVKSLIEKSWKIILEDGLSTEKQSTISTSTKTIIQSKICTCLIVVLLIARLTHRSKPSGQLFSNEESSISTNLKEFINYAEQKNERPTLFDEPDDVLVNLCGQARKYLETFGCLGDAERAAEILFERDSLRWDHPSSRNKRKELAGTSVAGAGGGCECLTPWDVQSRRVYPADAAWPSLYAGDGGGHGYCLHTIAFDGAKAVYHDGSYWVVRRLMPIECERLQGFPDGWTDLGDTPDTPRYKALGNSMAVPVMRWIGERIKMVEKEDINGL